MTCGIYKIINNINGKIYIGQSIDIKKRYREHIFSGTHNYDKDANSPIHKAMKKYGKNNFSLELVESCSREELNEKEKYWIQYYDSYNTGYNATLGGDTDSHYNGKEVELYDLQGNYVTSYPTVTLAAEAIGVSRNTIYQILYGYRLSTKGYQFKYKNEEKEIKPYKNRQGGKIPVIQLDLKGNIIQLFDSAADAARQINGDSSCITKVCKGKIKTHKGYKWQYA